MTTTTPTEMSRALRDRDLVFTHAPHVVAETHDNDRLTTECKYHLYPHQYERRVAFTETYTTVTHLCHHCLATLREDV